MDKKGRAYDFCAYRGCTNGKFTTNSRLYRFPTKKDKRLATWIENAGNDRLRKLAPSSLRCSGLCEDHFEPSCIVGEKRTLSRTAVPKKFVVATEVSGGTSKTIATEKVTEPCKPSGGTSKTIATEKVTEPCKPSGGTSKTIATEQVTEPCEPSGETKAFKKEVKVTTEECAAVNSLSLQPLRSGESKPLVHDKSCRAPTCILPTSTVNIRSGASTITNPTADPSVSEHVRKYEKPKLDFSESDDESCKWKIIEPKVQSMKPFNKPRKQPRHLKNSKSASKRRILKYQKIIKGLRQKLMRVSAKNKRLENEAKKISVDEFLDRHKCTEPAARAMVKLQLHHKKAPYTEEEKDLAVQLYYYSAPAYSRLRKAGCSFPSESSVRGWVSEVER